MHYGVMQKMKAIVKHINVIDLEVDALIYSTNVFLNCSGGVGSCLLERYGNSFQESLHSILKNLGVSYAEQGSVFELVSEGLPYKAVFHTVPCDGFYDTSSEIVAGVLESSLDTCVERGDIESVAISILASGYGHMEPSEFLRIASCVLSNPKYEGINTATICIYDEYLYNQAACQIKDESLKLVCA